MNYLWLIGNDMAEKESRLSKLGRWLVTTSSGPGSQPTTTRSTILLASLILMYAYIPLDQEFTLAGIEYVFIAVVVAMVATVSTSPRRSFIAVVLGVAFAVLLLLSSLLRAEGPDDTATWFYIVMGIFVAYAIIVILYEVTRAKEFSYHLIVSAISAYLLLALLWGIIYAIIETLSPGSFSVNPDLASSMPRDTSSIFDLTIYFSLITMTTVGYGDISPISATARSLASIEPLMGQLLMTVLVAWLVGMFISTSIEKREQERDKNR